MDSRPPAGSSPFEPLEVLVGGEIERIPVLGELPLVEINEVRHWPPPNLADLPPPRPRQRQRRVALPLFLFLATCVCTFLAGAVDWGQGGIFAQPETLLEMLTTHWRDGLWYMLSVMAVLGAHEMGHFLQAVRYHVPASLPFFIPMPLSPIGTMGAVIGMHGSRADRRQMFDIGITGPLAGLLVALPLLWYGIATAEVYVPIPGKPELNYGTPLVMQWVIGWARPDLASPVVAIADNPYWKAAWVGLLITGLNMLPVSQLDGGHVAYALFRRRAHWLARGVMILAMLFILVTEQLGWLVMLLLVMLIGTDHPPTRNDEVPLGPFRYALGIATLAIPIVCLSPAPLTVLPG